MAGNRGYFHCVETLLEQAGRRFMPQVMEAQIIDLGPRTSPLESLRDAISFHGQDRSVDVAGQRLQH